MLIKPLLLPGHFQFVVAVLNIIMEAVITVNMHDKKCEILATGIFLGFETR